jgi:hypothetical protein
MRLSGRRKPPVVFRTEGARGQTRSQRLVRAVGPRAAARRLIKRIAPIMPGERSMSIGR